jgi:lipopolysaccharide transport system ATP-binding protein
VAEIRLESMTSSHAIMRTEGLGKRYQIGQRLPYRTLRESVRRWAVAPLRRLLSGSRNPVAESSDHHVWALRDVSFEVMPGEVLGVIGRNGAGKSTLLKILTRITSPTVGRAEILGRVGSLLEVGTGFHPELTGRENVYLSGAVLGMHRSEVRRKFDEIVDFSGVGQFLDTPVKRYSSGMQVRLAFAVAAHLEPEILLIDEVLAVGDASFQKKCVDKMRDIASGGRTVLFISHDLGAVAALCHKAMVLDGGRPQFLGPVDQAVQRYLQSSTAASVGYADLREASGWHADRRPQLLWVSTHDEHDNMTTDFSTDRPMSIRIGYELEESVAEGYCQINVFDQYGSQVTALGNMLGQGPFQLGRKGTLHCLVDDLHLANGEYSFDLAIGPALPQPKCIDHVPSAISIRVHIGDYLGGVELPQGWGAVAQRSNWTLKDSDDPPIS